MLLRSLLPAEFFILAHTPLLKRWQKWWPEKFWWPCTAAAFPLVCEQSQVGLVLRFTVYEFQKSLGYDIHMSVSQVWFQYKLDFIFFFPSTFCVLLTLIHLFSNFSWALQTDIDYFTVKRDLMI